jgi:hypothetical protein
VRQSPGRVCDSRPESTQSTKRLWPLWPHPAQTTRARSTPRPRPVTLPRPLPPRPRLPRLPAPLPPRPAAPRSVAAAVVGEPVVVVGEAVVVGAAEAAVVARRWRPLRRRTHQPPGVSSPPPFIPPPNLQHPRVPPRPGPGWCLLDLPTPTPRQRPIRPTLRAEGRDGALSGGVRSG